MSNECLIKAALVSVVAVYKRLSGITKQLELTSATLLQNVHARIFSELKGGEDLQQKLTIQVFFLNPVLTNNQLCVTSFFFENSISVLNRSINQITIKNMNLFFDILIVWK